MTKEQYETHKKFMKDIYFQMPTEEVVIQNLINRIIGTMYEPIMGEQQFVKSSTVDAFISEEAINWGDLRCTEVVQHDNGYLATIEEASPDVHHLCRYIERLLYSWGWSNVQCKTEW